MAKLICRFLLWLSGWKVKKTVPKEASRSVMIAAPHTTNWDAYYLKLAAVVLDIPMRVAIKDTWTKGIVGWFVNKMGALGIDRSPKEGSERLSQTDAMANLFDQHESLCLIIAPEGTRKKRNHWKMGFFWVAKTAQVPVTLGFLDYENKIAGVGDPVIHITGEPKDHLGDINNFYRNIKGKYPEQFTVDLRFEPK